MKKRELLHLNGLVAEIANFCKADGLELAKERYRLLNTSSIDINNSKQDHRTAVLTLTDELDGSLSRDAHEPVPIEES